MDLIRRLARLAFFAGLIVVITGSLIPGHAAPEVNIWDKLQHLAAYGLLALTAGIGFRQETARRVAPALVLLGIVIELLQWSVIPGRYGEVADAVANTLGVALGYFGAWLFNAAMRSSISASVR